MSRARARAGAMLLACAILSVRPSPATAALDSPYAGQAGLHLLSAGGALGVATLLQAAVAPVLRAPPSCVLQTGAQRCDPASLTALDRAFYGQSSVAWRRTSDVGRWLALGAPLLLPVVDRAAALRGPGAAAAWAAVGADVALAANVVALTDLLTDALKFSVRRPRPVNVRAATQAASAQLSVPSGHTAAAAAALSTLCVTYAQRHVGAAWRWRRGGLWALSGTLLGVTAYGRVAGGQHFASDVLAGALLGASMGSVLPAALGRRLQLTPPPALARAGLGIRGSF